MWTRRFALLVGLAALVPQAAWADIILPPNSGTSQMMPLSPGGNTFTAEFPWAVIGLYVREMNPTWGPSDYSIQIDLWQGAGTSGTHLAGSTFSGLYDNFSGYTDVDFSSVQLTVGQVYTVTATNDTPRWGLAGSTVPYAGGTLVIRGNPLVTNEDFAFRVLEVEGGPVVPEPSTVLLWLGLLPAGAALAWQRRRR